MSQVLGVLGGMGPAATLDFLGKLAHRSDGLIHRVCGPGDQKGGCAAESLPCHGASKRHPHIAAILPAGPSARHGCLEALGPAGGNALFSHG
jgi:hypothetical protein